MTIYVTLTSTTAHIEAGGTPDMPGMSAAAAALRAAGFHVYEDSAPWCACCANNECECQGTDVRTRPGGEDSEDSEDSEPHCNHDDAACHEETMTVCECGAIYDQSGWIEPVSGVA